MGRSPTRRRNVVDLRSFLIPHLADSFEEKEDPLLEFRDKVALVTGAGQGLGRATALRFAELGAAVAAVDVDAESAHQTAGEIQGLGGTAIVIQADVSDWNQVQSMMKTTVSSLEKVDILDNNVGIDPFLKPFLENTPEEWDSIIRTNLYSWIYCTRAVLEHMIQRTTGRVVSIASDAARVGTQREVVYSACKGGIISASKSLAREVARHGITVNVVSPGPMNTRRMEATLREAPSLAQSMVRLIPLRRIAEPEEVAAGVTFLASDEARYITGQVLSISGGLTMVG